jgi:invasion protein IalB
VFDNCVAVGSTLQVTLLLPTGVSLNFDDMLPADRSYLRPLSSRLNLCVCLDLQVTSLLPTGVSLNFNDVLPADSSSTTTYWPTIGSR